MSDIIRRKRTGEAWETVEDTGGSGVGTLGDVLSNGNDADGQGITNLADGSSAQDAATVHNVDQTLGLIGINLPLSNDPDAGGIKIENIGAGVADTDAAQMQQIGTSGEAVPVATPSTVADLPDGVAGGSMRALILPADDEAVGVAIAREGDTNARLIVFFPEEGGFYLAFGDGTLEPYNEGGYVGWDPDAGGLYLFGPSINLDAATVFMGNVTDLRMDSLPSADPHVAGQLWYDPGAGNVVKRSAGP